MGIPSFYRHLCRRFPQIIRKDCGPPPEWVCLDFNCAMYWVLRTMSPVATYSSAAAWETDFCDKIATYMSHLIGLAAPTKGAFVSCDGVVCAAKRRQQRLRRFKGPWTSAQEAAIRAQAGDMENRSSGWDQNALTPGTAFMAQLGGVLTAAGKRIGTTRRIEVIVSITEEPGEGEHKLLAAMRQRRPASCTIYGLDADLILLSMLLQADTGATVRLMREAQEFESSAETAPEGGAWRSLGIRELIAVLLPNTDGAYIRDYVAAMSLLGNDFLPRSLTQTVRNDGIPKLLDCLKREVWANHRHIVVGGDGGSISREGLAAVVQKWAATEEADLLDVCREAARQRGWKTGIGSSPADTALREWNASPARWATLAKLLQKSHSSSGFRPQWRSIYTDSWHAGKADKYCRGVAWVWDYYAGKPVDLGWTFDDHLPPLWTDVAAYLDTIATEPIVAAPPVVHTTALPSWAHLLSVLPAASVYRLLPNPAHHQFVRSYPWYWPSKWRLFDVGRGQMWECEPVIPIPPEAVVRKWAETKVDPVKSKPTPKVR